MKAGTDAVSAGSIAEFVSAGMGRHDRAALTALSARPNPALPHPRERRCARRVERRVAKHRKRRSLPKRVAQRFRHYSVEDRFVLAIKTGEIAAMNLSKKRILQLINIEIFKAASSTAWRFRISAPIWIHWFVIPYKIVSRRIYRRKVKSTT